MRLIQIALVVKKKVKYNNNKEKMREKIETSLSNGGISKFIFYKGPKVDLSTINSIYDLHLLDLNKLYITGDVLGCKKDKYKISFKDFYLDNKNHKDWDFYNYLENTKLQVAFIKCDGTISGFTDVKEIKVKNVIEASYTESTYWKVKVKLHESMNLMDLKPIYNKFLVNFFLNYLEPDYLPSK